VTSAVFPERSIVTVMLLPSRLSDRGATDEMQLQLNHDNRCDSDLQRLAGVSMLTLSDRVP
jgi:hypothetical protein